MYIPAEVLRFEFSMMSFKYEQYSQGILEKLKKEGYAYRGRLGDLSVFMKPEQANIKLKAIINGKPIIAEFEILNEIKKEYSTTDEISIGQFQLFYQRIRDGKITFKIKVEDNEYLLKVIK